MVGIRLQLILFFDEPAVGSPILMFLVSYGLRHPQVVGLVLSLDRKAVVAGLKVVGPVVLVCLLEVGLPVRGSSLVVEQVVVHVYDLVDLGADLLLVGSAVVNRLQFFDLLDPVFQLLFGRFDRLRLFKGLDRSGSDLSPLLIRWKIGVLDPVVLEVEVGVFQDAFWLPRHGFRSLIVVAHSS